MTYMPIADNGRGVITLPSIGYRLTFNHSIESMKRKTSTIELGGMSCDHCLDRVKRALERTTGVEVLDLKIGSAHIAYDPATVGREEIDKAIEEEGFRVICHLT
jgi:copper chaperone CopZ